VLCWLCVDTVSHSIVTCQLISSSVSSHWTCCRVDITTRSVSHLISSFTMFYIAHTSISRSTRVPQHEKCRNCWESICQTVTIECCWRQDNWNEIERSRQRWCSEVSVVDDMLMCYYRSQDWRYITGGGRQSTNKSPCYVPRILLGRLTRHQRFC